MKRTSFAYTDGSSTPVKGGGKAGGGWAFLITDNPKGKTIVHEAFGYHPQATNNSMELSAVLYALFYNYNRLEDINNVVITTDSKYVADSVYFDWVATWEAKGWVNSQGKPTQNIELWKQLMSLLKRFKRRGIPVNIRWVKGHAGDYFNEIVDGLAKKGKQSKQINTLYDRVYTHN